GGRPRPRPGPRRRRPGRPGGTCGPPAAPACRRLAPVEKTSPPTTSAPAAVAVMFAPALAKYFGADGPLALRSPNTLSEPRAAIAIVPERPAPLSTLVPPRVSTVPTRTSLPAIET